MVYPSAQFVGLIEVDALPARRSNEWIDDDESLDQLFGRLARHDEAEAPVDDSVLSRADTTRSRHERPRGDSTRTASTVSVLLVDGQRLQHDLEAQWRRLRERIGKR